MLCKPRTPTEKFAFHALIEGAPVFFSHALDLRAGFFAACLFNFLLELVPVAAVGSRGCVLPRRFNFALVVLIGSYCTTRVLENSSEGLGGVLGLGGGLETELNDVFSRSIPCCAIKLTAWAISFDCG